MTPSALAQEAAQFALILGVVLLAANLGAEFMERVLRQPAVVGELVAGMLIGPFALGGAEQPIIGQLFDAPVPGTIAVPEPLWIFGQVAAVVLLFSAGLGTDFAMFMRYGPAALAVALGGVVVPFTLGDLAAVATGLASDPIDPLALFVGVVLTATSVGVTARVLSDIDKVDTPEGATILGAAVIDDVVGVIVLGIVVAVGAGGTVSVAQLGEITLRTLGFLLLFVLALLALARPIGWLMTALRSPGASVGLGLAVALICGYIAEQMGLAMIIGAYAAGLSLSRAAARERLEEEIRVVQHAIVPVFFVMMGMLVDVNAMGPVLGFGLALTGLAIVGKVVGAGLPALAFRFTRVGALRIGIGMVPRGEVALIVAGVGLASGAISQAVFSVAVMVAILTTVVASVALVPAFRINRPGVRTGPIVTVAQPQTGGANVLGPGRPDD